MGKEAYGVNELTCIGCAKCIKKVDCPALSFDDSLRGPKTEGRGLPVIDPEKCDGCGRCREFCGALMPLSEIEEYRAAHAND